MRALIYLLLAIIVASIVSCNSTITDRKSRLNDITPDSSWFESVEEIDNREKICEVNYYVSGDTLFTSQKYSVLTLSYSLDVDSFFLYRQTFVFDEKQRQNADGWYHIILNSDNIYREPATHLSAIVLHRFSNNHDGFRESKAYLYEATYDDSSYNQLSPQLTKLYPIIN